MKDLVGGQEQRSAPLPSTPTAVQVQQVTERMQPTDLVRRSMGVVDGALARFFPQGVVFAFDEELRYLSVEGLTPADIALSRELMEGRTIFEVFSVETCRVLEPLYRAALRGEISTVDVPFRGRIHNQRLAPALDDDGHVVAGMGFSQDVTDARSAEQALRESELRMRLTITNAPIGQALVELNGRWRAVNPALCALLGYSEAQLMRLTFQDITHPDDLDLDLDLLGRLVAGEIATYEMEKRYFTSAGRLVWVLLSVSLVRDDDGTPLYLVSQIVDITDRKRQQAALRDLTAMLAHDLRTPTTVIGGFAEIMITDWDQHTDEERLEAFRRIEAAAETMRGLLDNSLTASALDGQGLRADPTRIDLAGAVHQALGVVPHPDVDVHTEGLDGVEVWFDIGHLIQVLSNLITNAVKYGGDRLVFRGERRGDRQFLAVSDNGPGVSSPFVPHLFDRFSRADSVRTGDQRGSGLGLYIVKDLLELNDAAVAYTDGSSGGAVFTLDLPLPPT